MGNEEEKEMGEEHEIISLEIISALSNFQIDEGLRHEEEFEVQRKKSEQYANQDNNAGNKENNYNHVKSETTKLSKINNETYGISAEVSLCKLYGIEIPVSYSGRFNNNIVNKLIQVLKQFKEKNPEIIITKNCGYNGGNVDFKATIDSKSDQTLSVKTLMKSSGKIAPQNIGQKTRKTWDDYFNNGFQGNKAKDEQRFEFMKDNIVQFLNKMLSNLFCCNYLILVVDCKKTPKIMLSASKPNINFEDFEIFLTTDKYERKLKKTGELCGSFNTTIKMIYEEKKISIAEFQMFYTRDQITFRFYSKFISTIIQNWNDNKKK